MVVCVLFFAVLVVDLWVFFFADFWCVEVEVDGEAESLAVLSADGSAWVARAGDTDRTGDTDRAATGKTKARAAIRRVRRVVTCVCSGERGVAMVFTAEANNSP